jgi:hypothetical protein
MARRRWNFSVLQLLLLTALCGLCAGLVAASRRTGSSPFFVTSSSSRPTVIGWWQCTPPRVARLGFAAASASLAEPEPLARVGFIAICLGQDSSTRTLWYSCATGSNGLPTRELILWDVRRNTEVKTVKVTPTAYGYKVSPSGRVLLLSSRDGFPTFSPSTLELWQLPAGQQDTVVESVDFCYSVHIASDGSMIAAWTAEQVPDGTVRYRVKAWDLVRGSDVTLPDPAISEAVLSPDGNHLATVSARTNKLTVWNASTGSEIVQLDTADHYPVFSPDARRLATCSERGAVQVWDVASGTLAEGFRDSELARQTSTYCARFSPDGRWIVTGSGPQSGSATTISLWDANNFAHAGDLYRDGRRWARVAYTLGFVVWAAAWGWQSRRRRARDKSGSQRAEDSAEPPPKIVRMGLQPRKAWTRIFLLAIGSAVALALVFANDMQRFSGWSYPATLLALVPTFFVGFLLVVIGITLGAVVLPAMVRRWRGVPYLAGIARAERSAGVPGRRVQWGPVAACFLGRCAFGGDVDRGS